MPAEEISPELRAFVAELIHSVAQLELLLLLRGDATKSWSAADLGRALYISVEMAAALLRQLHEQNLVFCDQAQHTYRYAPTSELLSDRVEQLARLYETHRVSLITLIYSKPTDRLQQFAEGFRFLPPRKKDG
jgi:hypothetical protein